MLIYDLTVTQFWYL